jgi:hypothetical protein
MEKKGKIYVLKDPISNVVRYVGQTRQKVKTRIKNHIWEAINNKNNIPKSKWIRKLLKKELLPIWEIIEEVELDELDNREKYWISHYNNILEKKLLNLTEGGKDLCYKIREHQNRTANRVVYSINRFTFERNIFISTKEVAEYLKCKRNNIAKAIHIKGECKEHYLSYSPFPENWNPPYNQLFIPVELTDTNKNSFKFKSINHAIRFTKGTYSQHKNGARSALNNNLLYRGYYWKYIEVPRANNLAVKKSDELLENPFEIKDNQQPSLTNDIEVVKKVQRLIGEESTNKPNTSVGQSK